MLQYVVVKFLSNDDEDDDHLYEAGLTQWVLDNQKETYWPPREELVPKYIERLQMADPLTWKKYPIKIKRFKGLFIRYQKKGLKVVHMF